MKLFRVFRRSFVTSEGNRVRAAWRGVVPAVTAQLVQLLGVIGLFAVLNPGPGDSTATTAALATVVAMGLLVAATAGVALLVSARLDGRSYADYGFEPTWPWVRDLAGGVAIGVAMVGAVAAYLHARGYATVAVEVSWHEGTAGPLVSVAATIGLLFYFLANNVYEEVVFRSIVLRNFAEGLTARAVGVLPAVGSATVASLVLFGAFHPLPPGGGSIHSATTSAGLGLVFALAYVLTGDLSLPVGVHFGGVFLLSMSQQEVLGLSLPSVVVLDIASVPTYEVLAVRVLVGVALVLGWASLFHGGPAVREEIHSAGERPR